MNTRAIPRAAVNSYLRAVRLPFDAAINLLPGDRTGIKPAAAAAVDRVDARTRSVLGFVLNDAELREEAQRRREAVRGRQRAGRLREEAERKSEQADERLERRQQKATQARRRANQRANTRRQAAQHDEEQKKRQAAEAEKERLEANERTAERVEELLNEREPHERLGALSAQDEAQREKEKELVTREEGRRLEEAAERAKSDRKAD